MSLLKYYMQSPLNYTSRDKPARAFNSTLTRGAKPEVFRWATEWIEAARTRQNNLPKDIQYLMDNIRARFGHLSEANPRETLKRIAKVRRLINQSLSTQYMTELQELEEYEARLTPNN